MALNSAASLGSTPSTVDQSTSGPSFCGTENSKAAGWSLDPLPLTLIDSLKELEPDSFLLVRQPTAPAAAPPKPASPVFHLLVQPQSHDKPLDLSRASSRSRSALGRDSSCSTFLIPMALNSVASFGSTPSTVDQSISGPSFCGAVNSKGAGRSLGQPRWLVEPTKPS